MNFKSITGAYEDYRYSFILQLEESSTPHLTPYNDGRNLITIGIGFNLSNITVRGKVFTEMGITNASLIKKLTDYLSVEQNKTNSLIQSELNEIMNQYVPGATFRFADENQVKLSHCSTVPTATTVSSKPTKIGSISGLRKMASRPSRYPENAWRCCLFHTMVY